jgi:hypothetical protein
MTKLAITGIATTAPPTFHGQYRGEPILIGLDSSAVMKLEGNGRFATLPSIMTNALTDSPHLQAIERAAQRLMELRDGETAEPLIVSALDFD